MTHRTSQASIESGAVQSSPKPRWSPEPSFPTEATLVCRCTGGCTGCSRFRAVVEFRACMSRTFLAPRITRFARAARVSRQPILSRRVSRQPNYRLPPVGSNLTLQEVAGSEQGRMKECPEGPTCARLLSLLTLRSLLWPSLATVGRQWAALELTTRERCTFVAPSNGARIRDIHRRGSHSPWSL